MSFVGFSTGSFYKLISTLSKEAIMLSKNISTEALEICCVGGILDKDCHLNDVKKNWLRDVDFVSLHSPCSKNTLHSYADNKETHEVLQRLQEACDRLPIDHVVFHPDTIKDWKIFRDYDFEIAIENMDNRKSFGLNVEQMKFAFDQIDCDFVLDLNHCYTLDNTMRLADELLNNFSDRLCEIHVSGYKDYHNLLYQTKQDEISIFINQLNVPIIIESVCQNWRDAKKEFDYIKSFT